MIFGLVLSDTAGSEVGSRLMKWLGRRLEVLGLRDSAVVDLW